MIEAEELAIEEINSRMAFWAREIKSVIADGKSDWPTFAQEAQRLIEQEKVSVIFGCWTSASRKSVKPVVEQNQHLLDLSDGVRGPRAVAEHHLHRRRTQPAGHSRAELVLREH